VREALSTAFGFDARDFGQSVALSEVIAVIQNVPGVVAVDVTQLYRTDASPGANPEQMLVAHKPIDGSNAAAIDAAELLLIDPTQVPALEPMP